MEQKVLVVNKQAFERQGYIQRFTTDIEKHLSILYDPKYTFFINRDLAENNNKFKQVICYIVLRYKDSLFCYLRGKSSMEKRLLGLHSVGLGGHVEPIDKVTSTLGFDVYRAAALREVTEEVSIQSPHIEHVLALINDDSNEVGRFHIGILHVWELSDPNVYIREIEIDKADFLTFKKLKEIYNSLESWSQISIDVITMNSHL